MWIFLNCSRGGRTVPGGEIDAIGYSRVAVRVPPIGVTLPRLREAVLIDREKMLKLGELKLPSPLTGV